MSEPTCPSCGLVFEDCDCPQVDIIHAASSELAAMMKARDQWRQDAVSCQSIATSLDVHLAVARRSLAEQDERIAELKAKLVSMHGRAEYAEGGFASAMVERNAARAQAEKMARAVDEAKGIVRRLYREVWGGRDFPGWAAYAPKIHEALGKYREIKEPTDGK